MQVPSKLFSYEESTFSKFPLVLRLIEKESLPIKEIYLQASKYFEGPADFVECLDALFTINKIDYDKNNEVIIYVD